MFLEIPKTFHVFNENCEGERSRNLILLKLSCVDVVLIVAAVCFRCLRMNRMQLQDPVLQQACERSAVRYEDLGLPRELTVWVDPGEVSCRSGCLTWWSLNTHIKPQYAGFTYVFRFNK